MGNTKSAIKKQQTEYSFKLYKIEECVFLNSDASCPLPRSGHRMVCFNNNLYVFGGYNPNLPLYDDDNYDLDTTGTLFKELWKYNTSTKRWTKLSVKKSTIPDELASTAAVVVGNNLYIIGGSGYPFGVKNSNKVHRCNLTNPESFTLIRAGDNMSKRYGHAVVRVKDVLFSVGGTDGYNFYMDLYALDLKTCVYRLPHYTGPEVEWQEVRANPNITRAEMMDRGSFRHELVVLGTCVFIIGGGTLDHVYDLQTIPYFSTAHHGWLDFHTQPDEKTGDYPVGRRSHGCIQMNGTDGKVKVLINGGCTTSDEPLSDFWVLDMATQKWAKLEESLPVFFHTMTVSEGGKAYIFGGVTKGIRTNQMYSMWTKIPSLSEMCWDAMTHYCDVGKIPKTDLLLAGVPQRFVDRVFN